MGDGARLRISNGISDYSLIGTKDVDDASNTRIVISGNTRSGYAGHIEYVATAGSHIFYTGGVNERMRITNAGRVAIGLTDPLSRLCLSCDYNDGESTGFSIDSRDGINAYNLKLFSFVQGYGQVGYKFKVRNIADTYEPLTIGYNGRVGIQNNQPQAYLHLGNSDVVGSNPAIVFWEKTC